MASNDPAKRILLTFLAHPDDESFGLGGTLARYAAEGVEVHIVIATDGAAGSIDTEWDGDHQRLVEERTVELKNATAVLGGTVHMFCYRDSGYVGDSENNNHPQAFIQSDLEEVTGKVVHLIRKLRPQVVITHDETGGYYHPDHIHCWKVGTAAFHAAGDESRFPDQEFPPFRPQRLYYSAIPKKFLRFFTLIMRLRRQDPTKVGRNEDIDLTKLGIPDEKVHARIDYRAYWDKKREASAQHKSQGGGANFIRFLPVWLQKRLMGVELYQRAYPPTPDGYRETDLFTGVE